MSALALPDYRALHRPTRPQLDLLKCRFCGKLLHGEVRLASHQKRCEEDARPNRTCDVCGEKCPIGMRACVKHTLRDPDFVLIDVLIEWKWGTTPQTKIPKPVLNRAKAEAAVRLLGVPMKIEPIYCSVPETEDESEVD